jgi:hypothetical protein
VLLYRSGVGTLVMVPCLTWLEACGAAFGAMLLVSVV